MPNYEGRQALLQAAEDGDVDRVYAARRDRFSRGRKECAEVLQTLEANGVEVVIVSDAASDMGIEQATQKPDSELRSLGGQK